MKLPTIYVPLTQLSGYTMWNMDEKHEIMYFYYRIKIQNNNIRLFLYLFLNESFSGVEHILDAPEEIDEQVNHIVHTYKLVADEVLGKRDRLKRILE
jgi:hypothetical protein